MRLINQNYDLDLSLSIDNANVLCIENSNVFSEVVSDLWRQGQNVEGAWILSDNDLELNISKNLFCIVNPISLDLNDRKLIKVLHQDMSTYVSEYMATEFGDINSRLVTFLDEVVCNQPYAIGFDVNIDPVDVFKIYNVCFVDDADNILERIVYYIKLWHRVAGIRVFVFVNLKAYLSGDEMEQLYEMTKYEQIFLVLIESHYCGKLANENAKIIDKDLCIIDC